MELRRGETPVKEDYRSRGMIEERLNKLYRAIVESTVKER